MLLEQQQRHARTKETTTQLEEGTDNTKRIKYKIDEQTEIRRREQQSPLQQNRQQRTATHRKKVKKATARTVNAVPP